MEVTLLQLRGGTPDDSSQGKVQECTPNPNEAALFMIMLQQYAFQNQVGTKRSLDDATSSQEVLQTECALGNTAESEYSVHGVLSEVNHNSIPYPFLQEMESVPTDPVSVAMNTREFQAFPEFQATALNPNVAETNTLEIPQEEATSGEFQQRASTQPAIASEELLQTESLTSEIVEQSTDENRHGLLEHIQQSLQGDERNESIHTVSVPVPKQKSTENQRTESQEVNTSEETTVQNEVVLKRETSNQIPVHPHDFKKQDTSHREQRNDQALTPERQVLSPQEPSVQATEEISVRETKIQSAPVKSSSTIHLQPANTRVLQNTAFQEIVQMTSQTEVSSSGNTAQIVLDQVVQTITLSVKEGTTQLKLKLQPPTLGEMLIKVKMEEGTMRTEIELTNPTTRALIEGSLPQLREALSSRGIEMQKIEIITSQQPSTGMSEQRKDFKENKVKQTSFVDEETPVEEERLRTLGYNTMEITL